MKELFNEWIEFNSNESSSTNRFIHECARVLADELMRINFNGTDNRLKVTVLVHEIKGEHE